MRKNTIGWLALFIAGLAFVFAGVLVANSVAPVLAQGGGDGEAAINATMDRVEEATAILRGLEPRITVARDVMSRDELYDYLVDDLETSYTPEMARNDAIFYHAFDFMPLDTDLRQLQLDVLAEQIAGFYDSEEEAMFVIGGGSFGAMDQIVYAHEFTHALQDQYFDLDALLGDEEAVYDNPDGTYALLALVEGDAMLMTEGYQTYLMRQNPAAAFGILAEALFVPMDSLVSAPHIIQQELLFPYTIGRSFAYTLFVAGDGWGMVNDAYANPPTSTEQVLHPERYVGGEQPITVTVEPADAAPGEGWRLVWDRTLGEFYLREHLRQRIPNEAADAAAAGWGGDRYLIYFDDDSEETTLVWRLRWDTSEDAAEFAAAYRGYGEARFDDPGTPDGDSVCWEADVTLCLYAGEVETLVIVAPDASMVTALFATQPVVG